jgi:two-component system phosphate regulon sensor histidine kinase PhoR
MSEPIPLLHAHSWQVSIGRLVLPLLIAGGLGLVLGHLTIWLLLVLGLHALWILWQLRQLQNWLFAQHREPPPDDLGVLSEVASFVHTRHLVGRSRQRRLVNLLRVYREAAESLPDGILVLSDSRQLVWSNAAARRLLGLDRHQHRGQIIDRLIDNRRILDWLGAAAIEPTLLDVPAPANPDLRLSLRLIPYASGQWLLVVRDISKLLQLEQVRRDFVANVSHELRTPLTVIHGYLEMMEPDQFPESAGMITEMRHQSSRMAQIVEDLLTLSRLDANESVADEVVAVATMLGQLTREAITISAGQHQISFDCRSRRNLKGSTKDLHSAFSNLVFNAVRYTPAGGRIALIWEDLPAGGAGFSVSDSGYGIPAEHLPRITERFYRVSTSRSRDKGGTGLGLSIVKHVLVQHQAHLRIASEPGVGSTFYCDFPESRLTTPNPPAAATPMLEQPKIEPV